MRTPQVPWSIAARLGTLLFSAVFALAFGGGGLSFGLLPLDRTMSAAWEVRSWQAVLAEVLSSQLTSNHGSDSTTSTYAVQAHYRYTAGGRTHESTRVGLDPVAGSDNIGDWHQQWHARLSAARDRGQPVTVWVDPADPTRVVLDPHIRWAKAIFHLPFALVFTGVGLGALWVFWRALSGLDGGVLDAAVARSSASRSQRVLWGFAPFWCGISFPMAALMWMTGSPWWAKAFVSVFVVIGVGVLSLAWRQSVLAWRFAGTTVRFAPAGPQAGESFEVELALSSRALQNSPLAGRRLRLAQYRVDDSGSGTQERQVEAFERVPTAMPDMAGGERWHARFELPADAPTHVGRRSEERVDWRLEILTAEGAVEVSYDVPVQETPARSAGTKRRFRRAAKGGRPATLHRHGHCRTRSRWSSIPMPGRCGSGRAGGAGRPRWRWCRWRFSRGCGGRRGRALPGPMRWAPASGGGWRSCCCWPCTRAHGNGACGCATTVWSGSWPPGCGAGRGCFRWRRLITCSTSCSTHKSSGQATMAFHALHAREAATGPSVRLTPGLPGAASAVAVAQSLQAAREQRAGRFTPGALRPPSGASWRPAAGWLVWILWLLLLGAGPGWL